MITPAHLPVRVRLVAPSRLPLAVAFVLTLIMARAGVGDSPVERARRLQMVSDQVEARGIKDPSVVAAMREVPRHEFVPGPSRGLAYEDGPLPIGEGQTISQPFIVALMTSAIRPRRGMRVLEVGTGSGYQAAVLARCVDEV